MLYFMQYCLPSFLLHVFYEATLHVAAVYVNSSANSDSLEKYRALWQERLVNHCHYRFTFTVMAEQHVTGCMFRDRGWKQCFSLLHLGKMQLPKYKCPILFLSYFQAPFTTVPHATATRSAVASREHVVSNGTHHITKLYCLRPTSSGNIENPAHTLHHR